MSAHLKAVGCHFIQTKGDADVDIVKPATEHSRLHSTTLIGEDIDLLVLLLYYADTPNKGLYYRSDKAKDKIKVYDMSSQGGDG